MVSHGVCFCQRADHTAGVACGKTVGRDRPRDNAARTDDAAFADGDARQNGHIGTDPAALFHMHRLPIAQPAADAVRTHQRTSLIGKHRVNRRDNCDVGAEVAVFADDDFDIVLTGEVEIDKGVFADLGMPAVMEGDRPLQRDVFIQLAENFTQNFFAGLRLILRQGVVFLVEHMRLFLDGDSPVRTGKEELSVSVFQHNGRVPFCFGSLCEIAPHYIIFCGIIQSLFAAPVHAESNLVHAAAEDSKQSAATLENRRFLCYTECIRGKMSRCGFRKPHGKRQGRDE